MSKSNKRKFVYINAHPDDDIVVGGTMHSLAEQGWEVYEIVCSTGKFAFPENGEGDKILDNRISETRKFCSILGANEPLILAPNKRLFVPEEDIVLDIVRELRKIKPDVIAVMNKEDYHFEHTVAHNLGALAFEIAYRKTQPELGDRIEKGILLQTDGLNVLSNPLVIFNTSNAHAKKVIAMKEAYKDRVGEYLINFVDGLAKMRGSRVGYKYAEAYSFINLPWYKFTAENAQILNDFVTAGNGGDWKSKS